MDKEILDALRTMMREEIQSALTVNNIQMSDLMDAKLAATKREIMEGFNTVIEDKVSKEIRLIAEQHGEIVKKLEKLAKVDDLEDRVQVLELTAKQHTSEIQALKRA